MIAAARRRAALRSLGEWSWDDVPIVGGVVQWTEDKAREGVAYVLGQKASYEDAKASLPALRESYTRLIVVMRDGTDEQRAQVAELGDAIQEAQAQVNARDGYVEQVFTWANAAGLSAWPLIPLAILAVLGAVIVCVTMVVRGYQHAHELDTMVKAGFTPAQIAKHEELAAQSGFSLAPLSSVGWLVLAGAAFFAVRPMLNKAGK